MARKRIHTRTVVVEVYDEGDGTISIEGTLEDDQPLDSGYFQGQRRPSDRRPPGVLHKMAARMRVDQQTSEILEMGGDFPGAPYRGCTAVVGWLGRLEGVRIGPGYTMRARELLGGPKGCAHMNTLLQVMANTRGASSAYYLSKDRYREMRSERDGGRPYANPAVNSCYMWREDGPLVQLIAQGKNPFELDL